MGRRENEHYFEYRKCLITALKAHEVVTNSYMWSWNQKISGLVFVKIWQRYGNRGSKQFH